MIATLTESTVEEAALSWFEELGYAVSHGPDIAPGEPATESPCRDRTEERGVSTLTESFVNTFYCED